MSPTKFDGTIRPARPDEAEVVARIWSDGWADGHRGHVPDELYAFRTGESYLPRATDRIGKTVVAEVAGQVVGFAVVEGDEIEQVYVDAAARGTGAALELLREAERVIREAGHAEAWLAVVEGNARARAFYERAGWSDDGPDSYPAEAGDGVVEVPVRKYIRSLREPTA
jgi:GNAT superfamily N-acetyltransferase